MLFIYILLMACASARRIHFLGAGKNHAPGHFHYKVSVPYAWDSSSSIEYFECESYDCNSPVSIRKIQITDWTNTAELQIQKSGTVYDIECDSDCLQHTVYKYVKVEFRTSTDVSGEVVETCSGQFVLADGSCTDTCVFENIKGVCSRVKILCLHGHETPTLSSSCRAYDRNAPICSEGLNTGDTCRCFSSCGVEVEMVATNEVCLNGKRSGGLLTLFKQHMAPIENALTNTYEFFYPEAPENIWYKVVERPINYTNLNRQFDENATNCTEGVVEVPCQCTTCEEIDIYMAQPGEICRNGTLFSKYDIIDSSITYISEYINTNGHFYAIMGVSQGAVMAMAYMADTNPFNKTVLIEGYVPDTLSQRISNGAPFNDIEALLYFAQQSPLYYPALAGKFTSPTVIEADVTEADDTYGVPQNTSVTAQIKYFLESVAPVPVIQNSTVMQNSTCIQYSGTECTLVACDTGYYISDDNITCIQCEPGYQCPCDICDTREECPPGQYQPLAGQTSCDNCSGIVSEDRTQCGLGICTNITNSGCKEITCPAGFYEVSYNVTTSSPAPAPVLSVETYVKCMPCEPGTFQSITGQTSCDACSPGTYQNATGQASCDACPAGRYQGQEGRTYCIECLKTINADKTSCYTPWGESCLSPRILNSNFDITGTYMYGNGDTMDVVCNTGYYGGGVLTCSATQGWSGTTNCSACAIGYGFSSENSGVCVKCSDYSSTSNATYNDVVGSTSVCALQSCPIGQGVVNNNSLNIVQHQDCVNCIGNTYSDSANHGQCKTVSQCYTLVTDSAGLHIGQKTDFEYCSPGFYRNVGECGCLKCPAGKYQNKFDQLSCKNCAVGKWSGAGSNSISVCLTSVDINITKCAPGSYYKDDECVTCPKGKYQDEEHQNYCKLCPANTYSNQTGNSDISDCNACPHYDLKYNDSGYAIELSVQKVSLSGSENLDSCQKGCGVGNYCSGYYNATDCYPIKDENDVTNRCEQCSDLAGTKRFNAALNAETCDHLCGTPFGYTTVIVSGRTQCDQTCVSSDYTCPSGKRKNINYPNIICNMNGICEDNDCCEDDIIPVISNGICSEHFKGHCTKIACDDGFYAESNRCLQCPANYVCIESRGFPCPAGSYLSDQECKQCPPGEYQPFSGETSCDICEHVVVENRTECIIGCDTYSCPNGKRLILDSENIGCESDQCSENVCCEDDILPTIYNGVCISTEQSHECKFASCNSGYHHSEGACHICSPGHFCPDDIRDQQFECPPGEYQPDAGKTTCQPCDEYINSDRTTCSNIPSCQTHTCSTGMRHKQFKSDCPLSGCTDEICCEQDVAPTISNGICEQYDANTCLFANCDTGHYRSGDNSTCLACSTGQYQSQQGQADCVAAAVGHYVAGTAQTAQTACSFGTSQSQQSQASCDDCVAGRYQTQQGQASCVNASVGYYAAGTAQTAQTACSSGTAQPQQGQTSCDNCIAGRYQNKAGQVSCNVCLKGYCPEGATEQLTCLAGNYITQGRTDCVACAAGTFQSRSGRMECDPCTTKRVRKEMVGEYQDQTGQTSCKACIGTVSLDLQSCNAKCKVGTRQHICPVLIQDAANAVKYKDNLENIDCGGNTCTHDECCESVSSEEQQKRNDRNNKQKTDTAARLSTLFTIVPWAKNTIDTITNASTAGNLEDELRIEDTTTNQTLETAVGDALTSINADLSTKMNEKMVESMEKPDEERVTEKAALQKQSGAVQMQARRDQAIDISALNMKAAKDAVKQTFDEVEQEEEAAEQDQTSDKATRKQAAAAARVAAKAAQKQLAVASKNIKSMIFESMKTASTAVTSASPEDLSVIVATKDIALNIKLDKKMEKYQIEFMKLKMAKDHSAISITYDWDTFDCISADINLDEMSLYDLEEVMFNKDEKAVACNLGKAVTYVEKKTDKTDDYNDYEVYCCGETSAGRLRRQLSSGYSCSQKDKDANNATVKWNELDTYKCPSTGDYEHLVMSLGGTFTGCFLESNGTAGWVHDAPGRTLGNCGASQCTVNNTNVTCLYLQESCQPACEAGYASNGLPLTCSGGDQYSTSETNCTGCAAGKKATAGATTCSDCLAGTFSNALAEQCTTCPTGWVSASDGSATCTDCDVDDKYNANAGQTECFAVPESGTNYITRIDRTAVECEYGGQPVYLVSGQYDSGCNSPEIVMFGRAKIKVGGVCANKCVKWYSTASGSGLVDGFTNPGKAGSTVIEVTDMAAYCTYLWGTTFNVPKSDEC